MIPSLGWSVRILFSVGAPPVRLAGLVGRKPDVVAAEAIKTGACAEMGCAVAVKATAVPIGRSGA